jgi:LysR family transcriptional regulator, transcriptional activator of nhaA
MKWFGSGHAARSSPNVMQCKLILIVRIIFIFEWIFRFFRSIDGASMEWLNYHHLRYFWVVAQEGNLARAAERLGISQPSISGQIRELEESLKLQLFRREGRRNVLTDAGQVVYRYAGEIFSLGREMTKALHEGPGETVLRIQVGLTDSFPKLMANEILKPLFGLGRQVQVVCREGKQEELIPQLAAHRLDIVLADEPPSASVNVKVYDHPLGETGVVFAAVPKLARQLLPNFPKSLNDAPALLPAENAPLRWKIETWLRQNQVSPMVVAEFEDPALMKVMAAEGRGFVILAQASAAMVVKRYRLEIFGKSDTCRISFHALTADRQIQHPAVTAITQSKAWMDSET